MCQSAWQMENNNNPLKNVKSFRTTTLGAITLPSSRTPSNLFWYLLATDYHLFQSMIHGLAGPSTHLANSEEMQNWLDQWFRSKHASFYRRCIHILSRDGKSG
ncbi:hypothetical protein CEXT_317151 [Caerostris extrusa]|uniref:Uncharacterized protein n=1 Tax=Caerostris extrusa TaxID=172846 RepID=A0AAV4TBS8_CAEEX|nr:hypothetical protein CEXT_317151 [Caerostris extrusa]